MPVSNTGINMISEAGLLVNDLKKMPSPKKSRIRIIPPFFSDFHANKSEARSKKVGMLWMRNPVIISPVVDGPSKTSRENISMKSMAHMARILGTQYNILIIISGQINFMTENIQETNQYWFLVKGSTLRIFLPRIIRCEGCSFLFLNSLISLLWHSSR